MPLPISKIPLDPSIAYVALKNSNIDLFCGSVRYALPAHDYLQLQRKLIELKVSQVYLHQALSGAEFLSPELQSPNNPWTVETKDLRFLLASQGASHASQHPASPEPPNTPDIVKALFDPSL